MRELETLLDKGLAAKGIGPKGLKPMTKEDLQGVVAEFAANKHPEALAATFVMAFQVLERNPDEVHALAEAFQAARSDLSDELCFLFEVFEREPKAEIEALLKKLANRVDLNAEECAFGVDFLLNESESDAYKAAFLQGLRVKRETDEENLALYGTLFQKAPRKKVELDQVLVDWSDPYDGMNRHPNLSFLGAVLLSALGVPVVIHASRNAGPKYGQTVLDYFSKDVPLDLEKAEKGLLEMNLAIVDQDRSFGEMGALREMRNAMRKRPFLATVEKMMMPFEGAKGTVLVTGYVHKAYKSAIPKMVMDHGAFDKIFLVKGVEGSVLLDPSKKVPAIFADHETNEELELVLEQRGESPKGELDLSEIQRLLSEDHPYWGALSFTISKIIEIALGRGNSSDIILEMSRLKNDGSLLKHFEKVRSFYSGSGEYV